MAFRRRSFRGRRTRRNWQWVRNTSSDTAVITAPGHYQEDLLLSFKNEYGFSINFPDITIWRIRIRISVSIKWAAAPVNNEQDGFIVGIFVDDPNFTLQGVESKPYMEKYMFYQAFYYQEAVMMGAPQIAANGTNFLVTREIDIKARRRLGNIEDTLILQVGTTGSGVNSFQGMSYTQSTLLSLGKR